MNDKGFFSEGFPAKAFDANGVHTGPGPWLNLIWAANGITPGFFGRPELNEGIETYAHARVLHGDGVTVFVEATDGTGDATLRAAKALVASGSALAQRA